MNGFPLAHRATLGCHAEFRPGGASAFAAAAGGVQRGGVPLIARAAGGFTGGEDFRRGGGEAGAGEAVRGVAEAGEHLGAAGKEVWRQKAKAGVAHGIFSGGEGGRTMSPVCAGPASISHL